MNPPPYVSGKKDFCHIYFFPDSSPPTSRNSLEKVSRFQSPKLTLLSCLKPNTITLKYSYSAVIEYKIGGVMKMTNVRATMSKLLFGQIL